jgi:hypothetical protein
MSAYRWIVIIGISVLPNEHMCKYKSTPNDQLTTNSDSDLRELDEVNVRLAVRPAACREVPSNVRARDMASEIAYVMNVYSVCRS